MDDLEVYLDHLGYSFPINKKEDINMGVKGKCFGEARYGGISVGDEVSMCDPKVNTKGTVTFINVVPCSEPGTGVYYHVMWNNGMVGQYNRNQLLRTGNKGHLGYNYYANGTSTTTNVSNETVKLYFDNKPVYINTNVKVDHRPHPKFVQINNKRGVIYTTVVWKDGTHTIVKKAATDKYNLQLSIMYAVIKKLSGDNGQEMWRYFDEFYNSVKNFNAHIDAALKDEVEL